MSNEVREWVDLGKQYFRQREYDRAEEYLRRVVQQNPDYADVQNMLGVIYHGQGRFNDAITAFEKALELNPNYTEANLNLAVLYNDLGQYKKARKLYDRLLKHGTTTKTAKKKGERDIEPVLKGKLSNMHAEVGDIYFNLGLYAPAIDEYKRALTLNPTYADIQTKLGIAQRENGALQESAKTLRDAIKISSRYHQARVQLGVTLFAMGKKAEAKKAWQATLKVDPENANAKMYMSLIES